MKATLRTSADKFIRWLTDVAAQKGYRAMLKIRPSLPMVWIVSLADGEDAELSIVETKSPPLPEIEISFEENFPAQLLKEIAIYYPESNISLPDISLPEEKKPRKSRGAPRLEDRVDANKKATLAQRYLDLRAAGIPAKVAAERCGYSARTLERWVERFLGQKMTISDKNRFPPPR